MLVGRTELPPKDLKELFAYVKANNGKVSYGSVGLGSVNHLSMSWLANQQGLEMIHVPFKGVGPMVQEIAAKPARPRLRGGRRRAAASEGEPGEGVRGVGADADGGDPQRADVHASSAFRR